VKRFVDGLRAGWENAPPKERNLWRLIYIVTSAPILLVMMWGIFQSAGLAEHYHYHYLFMTIAVVVSVMFFIGGLLLFVVFLRALS
jgi:hypothetical protein